MESMIRKAEARDLEAVNGLLRQVLAVHHEGRPDLFHAIGKKYTDAQLLDIFANPDTPVFVYDRDGSVLGYAFCVLQRQGSGSLKEITTLYVDDLCVDKRARRAHIGMALFEHVKAFAREQGCHNLTLHVWACNPEAEAFYAALGLKPQYTCMETVL